MDELLSANSAIAIVSIPLQLAETCTKLHNFWNSIQDAPQDVTFITNDLTILSMMLKDIPASNIDPSPAVDATLKSCRNKLNDLSTIVEVFESSFRHSTSRKERLWTAFKVTAKNEQLRKFRISLTEVKSTLMRAFMYQNIIRPSISFTNDDVQKVKIVQTSVTDDSPKRQMLSPVLTKDAYEDDKLDLATGYVEEPLSYDDDFPVQQTAMRRASTTSDKSVSSIVSSKPVQALLKHSLELAIDDLFQSGTVDQLMDSTITRMNSFDSALSGEYDSESYKMHDTPVPYHPNNPNADYTSEGGKTNYRFTRSRVCHKTSSMGCLFGSIWVRTSTLKVDQGSSASAGRFEIITSFIFYPAGWLTRFGFRYGVEASLNNSSGGWKFNYTPVRAVPDSSLIFDLCRIGDTRAVELLLQRGDASIKDTSSTGWTPLHFAAAGGHVDLCTSLIKAGADKTLLAFEGPTKNALSPVTIFAESAQALPAAEKIRMLRLFADCLELSDPTGDGWTVIGSLVKAYNKENVPVSDISVNWLLRLTQSEKIIAFGAKSIWDGIQHAVTSFLVHERDNRVLQQLLNLDSDTEKEISKSHATSIAHWLALRASERELLPMVIEAGRFLHIDGFDWVDDQITPVQFVRALPVIYAAWAHALPSGIDRVQELVTQELVDILEKVSWTKQLLLQSILRQSDAKDIDEEHSLYCTTCNDDYTILGAGLVDPRLITFTECAKTRHRFSCTCSEFLTSAGVLDTVLERGDSAGENDSDVDEEFFKEVEKDISELCNEYSKMHIGEERPDPFRDAATMLYRAQGRRWIGNYERLEMLCGTCFLRREQYVAGNEVGAEPAFTEMPESFGIFRPYDVSASISS